MDDPLISCLMVTRGNIIPAYFAIECYRGQTYRNKELVIVCDRPDSPLPEYLGRLDDPSIRYIEAAPALLGDLRNISVEAARGSLVCQWDDDDLYHNRRLEFQAKTLLKTDRAAHFLARWMMWWPKRRVLALSGTRMWEGSMLARRDALGRYPSKSREEDTDMVTDLVARHRVLVTDQPEYYCYIVHGQNTCDQAHFDYLFEKASWHFSDYEAEMAKYSAHFPFQEYETRLRKQIEGEVSPTPSFFSGRTFGAQPVSLDWASFKNCAFNGTTFTYTGDGPATLEGCTFRYVNFDFKGPAAHTVNLLSLLTEQGVIKSFTGSKQG